MQNLYLQFVYNLIDSKCLIKLGVKMNKKLFTSFLTILAITSNANANVGGYVAFMGNAVDTNVKMPIGNNKTLDLKDYLLGGSFAIGITPENETDKAAFRMEVSYDYNNELRMINKDNSGDVTELKFNNDTVMINSYFDIPIGYNINPYLMAGAGVSFLSMKWFETPHGGYTQKEKDSALKFASQAGFGISTDVSSNVKMDAGYRYIRFGKLNFKKSTDVTTTANIYSVGVRIGF